MTAGELELLIGKVQQRADETCGTAEIRKKIRSGYGYVNGKFNEHVGAAGATGAAMLFSEPEKNENFSENIESQDDITEHTISALPCLPRCVYTHLNQILLTITNIANIYYGLIMMRLCAILTAMRKWEAKMTFTDVYCDDADFKTARGIVPNCIKHSLALFTMLPGGIKVTQPAKSNEEVFYILLAMPEEFTWSEFWAALKAAQFSKSVCNKALKKFVKKGFIVKKEGKYIKNTKALKKVSKRA